MNQRSESLSKEIENLSSELRRIERRLRSEPEPEAAVLDEFRVTVDSVRLTAWSVSELIYRQRSRKEPDAVLEYLTAERLRRFDQMARNLCNDLERRSVNFESHRVQSLFESIQMLQQCLTKSSGEGLARLSKDAVS